MRCRTWVHPLGSTPFVYKNSKSILTIINQLNCIIQCNTIQYNCEWNTLETDKIVCWYILQTVCTRIRPGRKMGLGQIQTVWHSDFFLKEEIYTYIYKLIQSSRRKISGKFVRACARLYSTPYSRGILNTGLNTDLFLMVANRVYPDEIQCVTASNQGSQNLILSRLVCF